MRPRGGGARGGGYRGTRVRSGRNDQSSNAGRTARCWQPSLGYCEKVRLLLGCVWSGVCFFFLPLDDDVVDMITEVRSFVRSLVGRLCSLGAALGRAKAFNAS